MKHGILTKGNVVTSIIAFFMSFLAGLATSVFTSDRLNIIVMTAIGGIALWHTFNKVLYKCTGLVVDADREAGYIGIIVAILLTMATS